jgi:alkanesulfonate monooxygenase SsuD/methylene tetrahydromethanopterin reductase-like flavin-dependent oxidoreductase (luciferase family)
VGLGVGAGSLESDFDIMELPKEGFLDRFLDGFGKTAAALRGRAEGPLAKDQAILRCAEHPIPIVSASASPRGMRYSAQYGAGLLFEGMTEPARLRELAGIYHEHGGQGPIVMIRRVWVGDTTWERQEKQMGVYRSYSTDTAQKHWKQNPVINGSADEIAERLAEAAHEVGADAINLRIQVPGVQPDEMLRQIEALGPAVARLRTAYPWSTR